MKRISRQEYMKLLRINRYKVKRTKRGFYKLDINKFIKQTKAKELWQEKQGMI